MSTTKGPPGIGHNSGAAEPETILEPTPRDLRKIASDYAELKEPTAANKLGARHLSLGVAIDLIRSVYPDDGDHLVGHLEALLVELQDLHDGHAADTLVPVATGHRPKGIKSEASMHRAGYAAQMEMLRRQGRPLQQAASAVLNTIPLGQPGVDWPAEEERQGDQAVARGLRQARPA